MLSVLCLINYPNFIQDPYVCTKNKMNESGLHCIKKTQSKCHFVYELQVKYILKAVCIVFIGIRFSIEI